MTWQPIEKAPKEAILLQGWAKGNKFSWPMRWDTDKNRWFWMGFESGEEFMPQPELWKPMSDIPKALQ